MTWEYSPSEVDDALDDMGTTRSATTLSTRPLVKRPCGVDSPKLLPGTSRIARRSAVIAVRPDFSLILGDLLEAE